MKQLAVTLMIVSLLLTGCSGNGILSTPTVHADDASGTCNLDTGNCIGTVTVNDNAGNKMFYCDYHSIEGATTVDISGEIGISEQQDPNKAYCIIPLAIGNFNVVGINGGTLAYNAWTANFSSMKTWIYTNCCSFPASEILASGKLQAQGERLPDGTVKPGITSIPLLGDPASRFTFATPKQVGKTLTIAFNSDLKEAHPDTIHWSVTFEVQRH
jgi:hypothetical protein